MFGTLKNIAITAGLPRALDNRCIVDGSFIAGIAGESEPDMYLRPDLDTFAILPWEPQQGKVARLLCDIYCRTEPLMREVRDISQSRPGPKKEEARAFAAAQGPKL